MAESECPDALKPYRWKPGQSGNLKGRPKIPAYHELLEKALDEEIGDGSPYSGRVALARIHAQGIAAHAREREPYYDRVDPKVTKHEIELPGVESNALADAVARFRSNGAGEIPKRTNGGSSA